MAAHEVVLKVPDQDPLWATAAVAISAALLGSAVGGFASFRANEALELSRRRARAQIRRKAKVYTPIRLELLALREACVEGRHFGYWRIPREDPPPVMTRPAPLHLWKDMVDDGRAMTAASDKLRGLLDRVDECADAFNRELLDTRAVLEERGVAILSGLGYEPSVINWVDRDAAAIILGQLDDLSIVDRSYGNGPSEDIRTAFVETWSNDERVLKAVATIRRVNEALLAALGDAITELDAAMRRIATKYENESPHD